MSGTSLSTNPLYEPLALAALLLKQNEEMAGSAGSHLYARRLVFEAATPVSSRSDPNPRLKGHVLGVGTSIIRRRVGAPDACPGSSRGAPSRSTRLPVVIAGILVADLGGRVVVAQENASAPEPWHPAIHQMTAADVPAVESEAVAQVVPAAVSEAAQLVPPPAKPLPATRFPPSKEWPPRSGVTPPAACSPPKPKVV
jgi:hypothetical protein